MRIICILVLIVLVAETISYMQTSNLLLSVGQISKIPFNFNDGSYHFIVNLRSISNGSISYILIEKQYCEHEYLNIDNLDFYHTVSVIKKEKFHEEFNVNLPTSSFCYIIRNNDITSVNINYSLNIRSMRHYGNDTIWIALILIFGPILCQMFFSRYYLMFVSTYKKIEVYSQYVNY
jgi:hypothetical protein